MGTLAEQAAIRDHAAGEQKTRIVFIDIGRSLGALLVFYSHLVHPWVRAKGEEAPYIDFLESFSSEPMHMATQGIGQIAVPFFFLVSGFVVTPIAIRQGHRKFSINRLIRVYFPMLFVVSLTALLLVANLNPPSTGQSQELNPVTFLTNVGLANYLIYPQVVLVPVAWTMIIEVLFYLLLLALLPVLRRSVWLAIAIELTLVFVVLMSRSQLDESYSLFAVNVSYLPIMIIGQVVWATTSKKIPLWTGGVFGGVAWMLYVLGDIIDIGRVDDSYNLALAFAVLCFLMGMFAEPRLRQRRFWTELSERSYSIYLLHMTVSFVLLHLLRPAVPLWISLLIAIVGTFAVVEVSYRLVERPSHALARKLSRSRKPKPDRAVAERAQPTDAAAELAAQVTAELPSVPAGRPRPAPGQVNGNGRVHGRLDGTVSGRLDGGQAAPRGPEPRQPDPRQAARPRPVPARRPPPRQPPPRTGRP